ncbi:hypothetical protein A3752_17395 [Oleiphilus sp. HI0081]|nr:hypothetical protein A3729_08320 [Oleiphilus sp. HI0043]KZY44330.1 hypothetical protein A3732_12570 [Oleiphilus sp. HI0050]KZY58675.1 hypothetical protein A3735_03185 [Oleiphilus sp. HI0061]KZY72835.1 hypothetical protein A3740_03910 [Oleiphilus sp. HI0068]KZY76005.1 hypothetical protein A3741_11450 [Oleiphilus sp. HI0069]KZZ12042.1 hypothetical protein A3749_07365 [Oleiphilus sp. HI0078]KZZ30253.1 hypothetical protein A3752_17395 [Oleiphilus sp. HI0081]KZZ30981.1 hypothetical protein A37
MPTDHPASPEPQALQGAGIGLRSAHYQTILNSRPDIPWFEALSDNYMSDGGQPLDYLEQVRDLYPVTFHGVGMSLGSTDPLDQSYLKRLKSLIERFQPTLVSDHLCWASFDGVHGNELFPMPYTMEAIKHIVSRIDQVQNYLGRRILVENVSSYLSFTVDAMAEVQFLSEVAEQADCDILCDVNNIYVSAMNHKFDPQEYIRALPVKRIKEMHLAGFEDQGTHLLDTHGARVHGPVWQLYQTALERFGPIPTLIEWDTDIPDFSVLQEEQSNAARMMAQCSKYSSLASAEQVSR